MKIAIAGTGYVGLVTGTCFAELGAEVVCVDVDAEKVEQLRRGESTIYEPGLDDLITKNTAAGRLSFSTSLADVLESCEVVFIAVGTPSDEDGSADLRHVLDVAREVGSAICSYKLIVTKSTVPVGTAARVRRVIADELARRGVEIPFDVAANPEFLKEGTAVQDFMSPDRVVVGVDSDEAREYFTRLYRPMLLNRFRVIFMDIPSAEMTKYAANAMLATRISFMNDIANLCELTGADVNMVRQGIGSDTRIGTKFLYPGCGYGGSCLPKDVKAIVQTASSLGYDMRVLRAVEAVNEDQKQLLFNKLSAYFGGDLEGRRIAVWGLAFKPETDDMREAPSLVLIDLLLAAGAQVVVYDPVATPDARRLLGSRVAYADDKYEALAGCDALLMVTEWKEFRMPSWDVVRRLMRIPAVFDGRNIYDRRELTRAGIEYFCIGG
ncbi:MAG: UDP-glucose/GDP-mannose dehydrogenase family protein [Rikenellaceae bacterium]|nr:UDP-glucose/GDP-mannose dehydrogenase family protein [Rikenellaceae bacterium]MCL2692238.1 UDP-glucose/GDP-mannose dehydrogenase family protein [Rikenellaceae bacterium]